MDSLNQITGLGPKTLAKLKKLNIETPHDLLYHFPSRYVDFSNSIKISDTKENENATITGKIISFQNIYTRTHKNIQKAVVQDNSGSITLIWFNQPYLSKNIEIGNTFSFAGVVTLYQNKKTIIAPEYGSFNTGKIIAVYPETSGLTSKWFRKTIQTNLNNLIQASVENLPKKILEKYNLLSLQTALSEIHLPKNKKLLEQARLRIALEEILSLQIQSFLNKKNWLNKLPKEILKTDKTIETKINKFIKSLPFDLTDCQKKVWEEIKKDLLSSKNPTNRLLQGDVGSGKTVIAALGAYLTSLNKHLTLFIAPTEILAQQHYQNFINFFQKFKVPIFLLTSSSKINFKKVPKNSIIIATHAAIFQKEELEKDIGFLIIDEQHKFGVKQRSFLSALTNPPHCLTMTATPIPRTISMTILGNLDLSTIEYLPKNRIPIKTFLVPNNKKNNCYDWLKKEIKNKKTQAFIVCPFIEPSETMETVKSAKKEFENLSRIFSEFKLDLIHGKLKSTEKEKILEKFNKNQTHILVTTPIIEVGIDIPNTTTIIIQSADRFGLAQLHQLRGRVGRGELQSFCYFFTESENEKTISRLKFLSQNLNGLKIAEYDLKTRGPGELHSTLQHGFPSLKLASISDLKLITFSQKILSEIISLNPDLDLKTLFPIHTSYTLAAN